MAGLKKGNKFVLISLLTLLTFIILFLFRSIDDNRLTSWQWVFDGVAARFYFIFIPAIVLAYVISRISLPQGISGIFLFLSSLITAMIFWREPEVIVDASRYFTQAKHLKIYGITYFFKEWGRDINIWTDMPLVPFLYGLIFKFIGEARVYIQLLTTILFSATVILTYQIGKTLWNEDVGFYGGLLLLGIPYLLTQVPFMLVDVPTMFFLTLSVFTFIRAMERGGWMIIISSLSILLAFFSKYSAWLMLSVLAVIFVVYIIRHSDKLGIRNQSGMQDRRCKIQDEKNHASCIMHRKSLFKDSELLTPHYIHRGVLIISIATLLIGVVFFYKFDVFSEQIRLLITFQKPGLRRWGESFISTFFFQIHPFITASALYSLYVALKKRDIRYMIISWLIILVFLFQLNRIRYIIMVFPMITLMASYGLCEIKDREVRKFFASTIVISSLIIAVFVYLPFVQKISAVNLKQAGEFLDSIVEEDIEVVTPPLEGTAINQAVIVPILDLFTRKRISYHYDMHSLPTREEIEKSSLRFTWEYKNPLYYAREGRNEDGIVVVIWSGSDESLPYDISERLKGYQILREFKTSEGVFQYRTFVVIYRSTGYRPLES